MIEAVIPLVLVGVLAWIVWKHITRPVEPVPQIQVVETKRPPVRPKVPMVHPNPCVNIPESNRPRDSPRKSTPLPVNTPIPKRADKQTSRDESTWTNAPYAHSSWLMGSSSDPTPSYSSSSCSSYTSDSSSSYSSGGDSGGGSSSCD